MKETILYINAGHGGLSDEGRYTTPAYIGKKTLHTNGKFYHGGGWFYEGVFNRDIANEFIYEATKLGYKCIPVFHQQLDTSRMERIKKANNDAVGKKALWLSFHANAIANSTDPQNRAEGVCTFVYKLGTQTADNAEKVTKAVNKVFELWGSKTRAQLVHDKALDETYYTAMPSMLFEIGFFDNPHNADLLINPKFRAEVIQAILKELVKIYE